nr:Mur ligase domain-containing protein [Acidobacteriota bacterium]
MTVAELVHGLPGLAVLGPDGGVVRSIAIDSRMAEPGSLFAALPGARADGARFAADAVARGAVAVLGRGPRPTELPAHAAWLAAEAPRAALAALAKRFFGAPDERLAVAGVTGTNGKTSTTHFLAGALERAGTPTAVGGTLGQRFGAVASGPTLTTPEAPHLFGFLAEAE